MNCRVVDAGSSQEWNDALARAPRTDIYFLPEYHRVHEINGDGSAKAFVAQEGPHMLVYPFMMRPIDHVAGEPLTEPWFDIETVYGYGGPLANTTDPAFLSEAWAAFASWCDQERVVAEFIRFHPLLNTHSFAASDCIISRDRETVLLELDDDEDALWQKYSSVHRNNIRKATKNGFSCEELEPREGMEVFKALYLQTMRRVAASRYYFFSDGYFDALVNLLGDRLKLFVVRKDDLVVAASLILLHGDTVHYHLSASLDAYKTFKPVNLLLHTIALWSIARGHRQVHLGGGRTPNPDDSLFTFKTSISRVRRKYYTGRCIRNAAAYEALCRRWMSRHGVSERPGYFLLYRLEET
jgi:hypothetical protein